MEETTQEQAKTRSITGQRGHQGRQRGDGRRRTINIFCNSRVEKHVDNMEDTEDNEAVEDVEAVKDVDNNKANKNKQQ